MKFNSIQSIASWTQSIAFLAMTALIASTFPVAFFVAAAQAEPVIEPLTPGQSIFYAGVPTAFRIELPSNASMTTRFTLTSSNGGEFGGANQTRRECTADSNVPTTIASGTASRAFCYTNTNLGPDTITATLASEENPEGIVVTFRLTVTQEVPTQATSTVVINKVVGGFTSFTAEEFDFTVSAKNTADDYYDYEVNGAAGTAHTVFADQEYTIIETGPKGAEADEVTLECTGASRPTEGLDFKVAPGVNATCTLTNRYTMLPANATGTLIIKKEVVGSTTAVASDYTLSVTSVATSTYDFTINGASSTPMTVAAGVPYTVTEAGGVVADEVSLSCDADASVSGMMFGILPNTTTTCILTNSFATSTNSGGGGSSPDPDPEPTTLACEGRENLLENGSFEFPDIRPIDTDSSDWELVLNVPGWLVNKVSNNATTALEIHRNWQDNEGAEGAQYVELDSEQSTRVAQDIDTKIGATYRLAWAFAARHSTVADNNILGVTVDGVQVATSGPMTDSSNLTPDDWRRFNYEFIATGTSTNVSFLDQGLLADSEGTYFDDAQLCLIKDAPVATSTPDVYRLEGFAWLDTNQNQVRDIFYEETPSQGEGEGERVLASTTESVLVGLTISITNGSTTFSTTTDENGLYYFEVEAGTWIITELAEQDGFELTTQESYVVVVPEVREQETASVLKSIFNFFIPTAQAAVLSTVSGLNFGNIPLVIATASGGGGGGTRSRAPNGQVAGVSTTSQALPQPLVLGEQVSVIPTGAPNAGHGGTTTNYGQAPLNFWYRNLTAKVK